MMFSEDYIMRLIRQASIVLARVLGLKKAGDYQEALLIMNQLLEEILGLDANLVHRMDDQSLLAALTKGDSLDTDRLLIVADLLREQGEILAMMHNNVESFARRLRALNFYLEASLAQGPEALNEPVKNVEEMLDILEGQSFPPETLFTLYVYEEAVGRYRRAERWLELLQDSQEVGSEASDELGEFYQRMLQKDEKELSRGGLSRLELQQKLKDRNSR